VFRALKTPGLPAEDLRPFRDRNRAQLLDEVAGVKRLLQQRKVMAALRSLEGNTGAFRRAAEKQHMSSRLNLMASDAV
jgi:hypothetical protein